MLPLLRQPPAPELQTLFFDLLQFMRLGETFGDHSLFDVTLLKGRGKAQSQLNLRNLVPAPFVGPRLAAAHSCTLFSATLIPQHFHRDLLGVPAGSAWVDVASPFAAEQLEVRLVRLSTRYADRAASRAPIAVPDASLRLIQACGRLLRTEQDSGTISLLDRRLVT